MLYFLLETTTLAETQGCLYGIKSSAQWSNCVWTPSSHDSFERKADDFGLQADTFGHYADSFGSLVTDNCRMDLECPDTIVLHCSGLKPFRHTCVTLRYTLSNLNMSDWLCLPCFLPIPILHSELKVSEQLHVTTEKYKHFMMALGTKKVFQTCLNQFGVPLGPFVVRR